MLIHGAAGGVGTALVQLGRFLSLEMYGTCSAKSAAEVSTMGAVPIDYRHLDFVQEVRRLTTDGVDAVFDGLGGSYVWRSREALRPGGKAVVYGFTGAMSGGRLASAPSGGRHRFRESALLARYVIASWFLSGRKRLVPYSIQWLKRIRPALFRRDLTTLLDLLQQQKIKPVIAKRFPLHEARQAHELLGQGGVTGKIVLTAKEASIAAGTT